MKIKEDFHHLIDSIEDEELLKSFYQFIQKLNNDEGVLWNQLTEAQRDGLLTAYEESFDNKNLLSHEQVKLQHEKWLRP